MTSYFVFTRALLNCKRLHIVSFLEATIGVVLKKNLFLEITQNLQENTCARVSFLVKLQAYFIFCTVGFLIFSGGIEDNVFKSRIIRNGIQRPSLSDLTRNLEIEETRFQFSSLSREQVVQTTQNMMRYADLFSGSWFKSNVVKKLLATLGYQYILLINFG